MLEHTSMHTGSTRAPTITQDLETLKADLAGLRDMIDEAAKKMEPALRARKDIANKAAVEIELAPSIQQGAAPLSCGIAAARVTVRDCRVLVQDILDRLEV